ncbi:MAG TPA: S-layer homology domain-containing protein [Candidatus Agathobaculum pullistercoris]|nr:S-layer homology domain-containing protein [uncultured Agathobaculum sp.]HIX10391.1 S-layer homology domain-containing protein [Candidatus Agathobaculum pullistercoris]
MKNLKKVLALVLAFACAFTMFAGAAFTDEADIQAKDAVNMLTSLGVIEGYEDGSFNPDGTVTRAEMAKMIFVVRNNTIDDSAYENITSNLTDINNHWAKGYIKFCESQGIIAGKGNGIFDPDATVTGTEAAKMLLVLAGYDADKAGLEGASWETNTLRYAGAAGILDNVASGLSSGLPRQYAAQMIYNTLDANRVKWSTDSDSFDDNLGNGYKETVGYAYMDLCSDYGTLTTITSDSLTIKLDQSYNSDNYHKWDSTSTKTVSFTKVDTDYSSLLGQTVKVMFKDGKTNNVLGVFAISDNTVYSTYMNQTELDGSKIKFGGTSYSVDDANNNAGTQINVIVDGAAADAKDLSYFDDTAENKVSMNMVVFADTDSNNRIDTAIVTTYTGGQVTYVGSDKITFDGKSYNFDDENIDENIAKDDWAVMSTNLYDDCKDIVRADILNTELTGYKEKDGYVQYELDGKWYNMASEDTDVTTGDNVKAYVYNGVVLDLDTDDGTGAIPTNIAVVVGKGKSGLDGDQAKIRLFDGTVKTVTMSDDSVPTITEGTAYKISGSDSDTKFEALTENDKYNGFTYVGTGAAAPSDDKIDGVKVADEAVIILWSGNGRSKQITGKQFNALSDTTEGMLSDLSQAATAVFTKETNGLTRVRMAAVKVESTDLVGESSDNYAYIVSGGTQTTGGDVRYTIWTGSENVQVTEDTAYSKGIRAKGTLIGYSEIDADGYINDVKVYGTIDDAKDASGELKTTEMYRGGNEANVSGYIAINGAQFNVTADTTVLLVDSKADTDSSIGLKYTYGDKLPQASKYKDAGVDKYLVNAFWIMDEAGSDDKDIAVLVIDSTGAFDGFELDDVQAPKITAEKTSGGASTTVGTKAELKYTLTASNYATDAADVTTSINSEDNTNITASGTGAFAVKNNGTQEITVTVGTSTAIGTYNIQIKAGNTVLLTDTFEVTAKPVATLDPVTANDNTTTFTEAGKVKAGSTLDIIVGKLNTNDTTNVRASFKIVANDRPSADTSVYTPVAGEKVTITATFTPEADYAITATAAPTLAGTNADADSFSVTNGIATATYTFTVVA